MLLMVEPFQNVHISAIITWVFDIYQEEKAYLKEIIKDKWLALIVKELIDDEGQKILDRLGLCLDFDKLSINGNFVAYLLGTHFLSATFFKSSKQENRVLGSFENCALIWDRSWWRPCFQFRQCCLHKEDGFWNPILLIFFFAFTLFAIAMLLILWLQILKEVVEFLRCFRNLFFVPTGRNSRFLNFLQKALRSF